ncbi:MAG: type II toxin-antitoxin system Phd/YefM family antitoxin [Pyramidobacter sp.]|uniref:type II toxin-antitoxin system Phd/YefM family antitoxin n=1 Tax=Pyramidobacter sp. TaxID=1943581 RepID=UPI0025DEED6A|nr:type II toxin-antitoxin system Phd/YefM family antitoxin [Pyramidobacter sp.]MCI7403959.1 type II toxin-antitoxin system Phd/YefM family antitoxin [Pyramidobacter sp.]
MLAVSYSTIRTKLKDYCDAAVNNDETIIVTRKNEENVVLLSLDSYNRLMKSLRNAEYVAKLDRAFKQLETGGGKEHELIEAD